MKSAVATVGVERQHVSWRRRCSVQADRLCEAHYDVVADLIQFEGTFSFHIDDDPSEAGMISGTDGSGVRVRRQCNMRRPDKDDQGHAEHQARNRPKVNHSKLAISLSMSD